MVEIVAERLVEHLERAGFATSARARRACHGRTKHMGAQLKVE
jgi:hypothetical protein